MDDRFEFAAAVERLRTTGGTIVLRSGRYGELVVSPRGSRWLRIVAQPGASARRVVFDRTQAVRLSGLRLTAGKPPTGLRVFRSRNIDIERLAGRGRKGLRVNVTLSYSENVRLAHSTFSRCGENSHCLHLHRNKGVTIAGNHFRDCYGCDFIRGRSTDVAIRRNSFERALPGSCGEALVHCNHQDLIHLWNGRRVLIDGNRFGVYRFGAAQIYLTGGLSDVTVSNNLFLGTDALVPGYEARTGIVLGAVSSVAPRRVVIKHNTILTGHVRSDGTASSVLLAPAYGRMRVPERPILANNVLNLAETPSRLCALLQVSSSNVFAAGTPCSGTDVRADPALDSRGPPTPASTPLIDRADLRYATTYDMLGVRRDARPDIGAFELVK